MGRKLHLLKTTFTSGELDPDFTARNDLKHYYSGAQEMIDVRPSAKSGFKRRPGLEFIADVTADIGNGAARWCEFIYDPDTTYGLLFLDNKVKVFRNRALVHTITGTPWDDTDIQDGISFCQEADTLIVLCNLVEPYSILRISDTSWNVSAITFDQVPLYDYVPSSTQLGSVTTPAGNLTPSAVTGTNINLTSSSSVWVAGDVGKFVFGNGGVARITKYSSAAIVKAKVLVDFYDTDPTANPDWTLDAGAIQPSLISGQVKIEASGPFFLSSHVGQKIAGGGGLVRITQFNSTTQVLGVTEIPFASTDPIPYGQWELKTGFEDAWSNTRGWPTHGCFHQGRLVLAGGPRLAAWGSRVGSFYDFALGSGLDADPWEVSINDGGKVTGIVSQKALIVFTNGAEFVDENKPATPGNVAPEKATKYGSAVNLDILDLDGDSLFIQKGGGAVLQYYYENGKRNFVGDDLTLLAPHLISNPTSFAKKKATSTDNTELLLLTNEDGTARECSIVPGQDVVAWSRITGAGGFFMLAGVDNQDVYFLVKRTIDSVTKYYVESYNAEHYLDCSVRVESGMPTATVTAAHLPSTEYTVMADDCDMEEFTPNGSGVATLPRDAEEYYEAGLNFVPTVISMPVEPELPEGTRLGKKKRIPEITLQLKDTNALRVQGRTIPFRKFGAMVLDEAPPLFTGRKRLTGFKGWSMQAQVTIDQPRPGSMNVLAMSVKVSV